MNITMNDLDINSTLDMAAMAELVGGYTTTYGSWKYTGKSGLSSMKAGSIHFNPGVTFTGKWLQWKRAGHQHGKRTVTYNYRRTVNRISNKWGL